MEGGEFRGSQAWLLDQAGKVIWHLDTNALWRCRSSETRDRTRSIKYEIKGFRALHFVLEQAILEAKRLGLQSLFFVESSVKLFAAFQQGLTAGGERGEIQENIGSMLRNANVHIVHIESSLQASLRRELRSRQRITAEQMQELLNTVPDLVFCEGYSTLLDKDGVSGETYTCEEDETVTVRSEDKGQPKGDGLDASPEREIGMLEIGETVLGAAPENDAAPAIFPLLEEDLDRLYDLSFRAHDDNMPSGLGDNETCGANDMRIAILPSLSEFILPVFATVFEVVTTSNVTCGMESCDLSGFPCQKNIVMRK